MPGSRTVIPLIATDKQPDYRGFSYTDFHGYVIARADYKRLVAISLGNCGVCSERSEKSLGLLRRGVYPAPNLFWCGAPRNDVCGHLRLQEMEEIKSALEIALEKAKSISVSKEEIEKDIALEQGIKLAAEYLRNPKFDLSAELTNPPAGGIKDKKVITLRAEPQGEVSNRNYILEGIVSVFLKNIILPENKDRKKENLRAMEGLFILKKEKDKIQHFFSAIDQFFDDYIQQRKQVYEHLRKKYESFLKQTEEMKNLEEQLKNQGIKFKIAVEQNPQFQQEWRALLSQIDHDYGQHLEAVKKELEKLKNID